MKLNKIMLAIAALTASGGAFAHGYIEKPESRAYLCQLGQNTNCGQAQYEPQSTGEGPDGFPAAGPRDGELASASGGTNWIGVRLNEQTADRWTKRKMQSGPNEFTWKFTAPHPIADFKYYITKENWNPNQPLTRDSLELTPFCVIPGGPAASTGTTTHSCDVPERSGYHVIYGAWDVSDTAATFYHMIDAEFEGDNEGVPSPWSNSIGGITPTLDLLPGSTVKSRVFDTNGERPDLSSEIVINSAAQGEKSVWAHALASKINQEQDNLRAGRKNASGDVVATYGNNTIYTKADSGLVRVEIQVTPAEEGSVGNFSVKGLQDSYTLTDNAATLTFEVAVEGTLALEGKIFDADNNAKGHFTGALENASQGFNIALSDVAAGKYTLVITGTNDQGQSVQESFEFALRAESGGDDYEFVYPQGLGDYKAGTVVLQPKTDKTYECKPFPYSGWCNIGSHHYVPGEGSNWQDAWTEK
uniref:N-acetylglucosamine-binding protein GbpA n=1 Tax=Serratia quinivorans TaxID=137545 RepID=UPI0035C6A16B